MNTLMHKTDFIGKVDVIIADDMIDINLYSKDNTLIKRIIIKRGTTALCHFATQSSCRRIGYSISCVY